MERGRLFAFSRELKIVTLQIPLPRRGGFREAEDGVVVPHYEERSGRRGGKIPLTQLMKTIVILSSEPWGKMKLSKMHFAEELATEGNKVFFVNPPRKIESDKLCYADSLADNRYITLIYTRESERRVFLRQKLFPLYRILENRYIKAIKKITGKIDELWCFNPQFIVDISKFGASKTLLFMYDFYKGKHLMNTTKQSDAILSVAQNILDYFSAVDTPKLLLNHGLASVFIDAMNLHFNKKDDKIRIGYVGNLLRGSIDISSFERIINDNPEIQFNIWGPAGLQDNNVSGADVTTEKQNFIQFLSEQKNVVFRGVKTPDVLAKEIQEMDAFLFIYSSEKDMNGAANSHKLMEYLSTGKAVFSTFVSHFKDSGLLVMDKQGSKDFCEFFNQKIKKLNQYNSPEEQMKRMSFAKDNSYRKQVDRIEKFLESVD
ncbi:MAG TPA: glycosyltransferase [Ginsengibacter sp.]|nr:glycosyltransferase [Ginsengibacter sp.]